MVVEEDEGEDQGNQALILGGLDLYLSQLYLNCSAVANPTLFFTWPTSVEVGHDLPVEVGHDLYSVQVAPSIPFLQNSVEGVHIGGAVGSDTAGASASEEQEEVSTHVGGGAGGGIGGAVEFNREELNQVNTQQVLY